MTATGKNTAVERLEGRLSVNFAEFRAEVNERLAKMDVQIAELKAQTKITMYLVVATFLSVFLPLLMKLIGS